MSASTKRLLQIVDKFNRTPILVVGDLILDHYIWGKVNRISPEAPVVVVEVTNESKRPGGAGNVVNNLRSLGAEVRACGVVGEDKEGNELLTMLNDLGADVEGVIIDPSRKTSVKTRVIAHSQQVVRIDREDKHTLDQVGEHKLSTVMREKMNSACGVIISDYAKGSITPLICAEITSGFAAGNLGFGKVPVLIDPKAPNYSIYPKSTVIKPNRLEAEEASRIPIRNAKDAIAASRVLLGIWESEMILLTLGEEGMVLVSRRDDQEPTVEIKTVAREVYDVSGAGDTVSAVFLLALAVGASPGDAAILANLSAGIVVGEVGTVAVEVAELKNILETRGGA